MYKIDLHTHSTASPDGGISHDHYKKALLSGVVDCVAITDHGTVDFALKLKAELKEMIIVGQEIMTSYGEIIGLFLKSTIPSNLTPMDTIRLIKEQGGLVYIPHPLKNLRHGLQINILEELIDYIDIVEIGNGRSVFQNRYSQIMVWANLNHIAVAASSDAHGSPSLGHTYTSLSEIPTREDLLKLLSKGIPIVKRPSIRALLYPKFNWIMKRYSV
jgi:hypothetical protein